MSSLLITENSAPPVRRLYLPNGSHLDLEETAQPAVEPVVVREEPERRVTKDRVIASLRTLADWMASETGNQELEEQAIATIDKVISDHGLRTKIFLVGLSHHRVQKILDLAQLVDRVEAELQSRPLDQMTTYTLLMYYNAIRAQEQSYIDYVRQVAEAGYPSTYDDPGAKRRNEERVVNMGVPSALTPTGRDRVATLLGRVRGVLEERGVALPS